MGMGMENRIALDYAMLLTLLMLMVKLMTGVIVHEALGVGFALSASIHILNNRKKLFRKLSLKSAMNYLLILALLSTVISGVLSSVVLFRFLNIPYNGVYYTIHTKSAYALLALSITHLALHMKAIGAFFKNRRRLSQSDPI